MKIVRALALAGLILIGSVLVLGRLPSTPLARSAADDVEQNRNAPPSACSVVVTETLGPLPLPICQDGAVTVTMALTCPAALPLHVVFVIAKHLGMEGHMDDAKAMARQNAFDLEFTPGTLAGLVTLSVQGRGDVDMTDKKSSIIAAINRIQLDRLAIYANYYDWLGEAQTMLDKVRDPLVPAMEAIVVYSTGCPTGYEQYCTRQVASARKAKGAGTLIFGACPPRAAPFGLPAFPGNHCRAIQDMASRSQYFYDLAQAGQIGPDLNEVLDSTAKVKLQKLTLTEVLGPSFALLPGSGAPSPRITGQQLAFSWDEAAPGELLTATYRVRALTEGTLPLRDAQSQVTFSDSLDRIGLPAIVPLRAATVTGCLAATATPLPTATATDPPPATSTPTMVSSPIPTAPPSATATWTPIPAPSPEPARAYLPLALRHACRPSKVPTDVVLAIDASSSMLENLGGAPKLDAAREAARRFLRLVDLQRDQVGLVVYSQSASIAVGLTHDLAALEAGLERISTSTGTRIDLALEVGAFELVGARAQSGATRVLILLTDGRPDADSRDAILGAATELERAGIQRYAIGLGVADDLDRELLRAIVSNPENYVEAPDGAALNEAYAGIVRDLPCPGGVPFATTP